MLSTRFLKIAIVAKFVGRVQKNNICSSTQNYNFASISEITNDRSGVNVLEAATEDLSHLTSYFPKSFNLAAYVNKSETLQNLIHLEVDLSKIEKKPHIAEKILKLDFIQDVKKHIFFIKDFVDSNNIGTFLTKNPLILCEALEDLEVRVNYLRSKHFSDTQISRIVSQNPFWLMFR